MTFDKAFERLIGHEGGYSNNPADPGGETMYGVTARVARRHGYTGPMRSLPLSEAKRIARIEYWEKAHIDALPPEMAFDMFDTAYNSSPARAVQFVQRAVGAHVDGLWGEETASAVAAMDPLRLLARFNGRRLDFLNSLPTWDTFSEGWAQRIAENLMEA